MDVGSLKNIRANEIALTLSSIVSFLFFYDDNSRPFVTGRGFLRKDPINGYHYMDGAFTLPFHPKCKYSLPLPLSMPYLYWNAINTRLGLNKAEKYFNAGLKFIYLNRELYEI